MWLQLGIVTLLAAVVQGIAGFSFTLFALFFYLLALRSTEAVQLVIMMNFAISLLLVSRLWRRVPVRLWALLAGGGIVGFPLGLWWFAGADLAAIELAVALVTIGFAVTLLLRELLGNGPGFVSGVPRPPDGPVLAETRLGSVPPLLIGVLAGAMTSSLGAPGPPIALYLAGLRLDKTSFRALAPAAFVVMQLCSIIGQAVYVGVDTRVWGYGLALAPVAVVGAGIGHRASRHVSERLFRRVVLLLLLAAGAYLLYRAG